MTDAISAGTSGFFSQPQARRATALHILVGAALCLALLLPASSKAQSPGGSTCTTHTDCTSGNCVDGICCDLTTCFQTCLSCAHTKTGLADGTCGQVLSGMQTTNGPCNAADMACSNGACLATHCLNGVKDGDETDVDCGGLSCPGCVVGQVCSAATDCKGSNCVDGICCNPVNCFGPCRSCAKAKTGLTNDGDCGPVTAGQQSTSCPGAGQACSSSGTCVPTHCFDQVKNFDETDVDCGGPSCPGCGVGQVCSAGTDCKGSNCVDGICCNPVNCFGPCRSCAKAKTGLTNDGDCGPVTAGQQSTSCPGAGQACSSSGTCVPAHCFDKAKNFDETDVDCGGSCAPCEIGKACQVTSDCAGSPTAAYANCVDGVCCSNDCYLNTCHSCAKSITGLDNGTCAQVPTGRQTTNGCNGEGQACSDLGTCTGPTPTATVTGTVGPTVTNTPQASTTPGSTPTPTPTAPPPCVGDCVGSNSVTVDEILTMVNIALGNAAVADCTAGDANHDGKITVDEILAAVNNALNGCSPMPRVGLLEFPSCPAPQIHCPVCRS